MLRKSRVASLQMDSKSEASAKAKDRQKRSIGKSEASPNSIAILIFISFNIYFYSSLITTIQAYIFFYFPIMLYKHINWIHAHIKKGSVSQLFYFQLIYYLTLMQEKYIPLHKYCCVEQMLPTPWEFSKNFFYWFHVWNLSLLIL